MTETRGTSLRERERQIAKQRSDLLFTLPHESRVRILTAEAATVTVLCGHSPEVDG